MVFTLKYRKITQFFNRYDCFVIVVTMYNQLTFTDFQLDKAVMKICICMSIVNCKNLYLSSNVCVLSRQCYIVNLQFKFFCQRMYAVNFAYTHNMCIYMLD